MGLAKFFDKAALSAAQILKGFERKKFEEHLNKYCIGIAFDSDAAASNEGIATLDLLVRLISRLYPVLQLIDLDKKNLDFLEQLKSCALSINSNISLPSNKTPTICIVVGNTKYVKKGCKTLYLGSDGWVAKFSEKGPMGSGISSNPIGAGASACFGAANLFKLVFEDQLHRATVDNDFSLSLFDFVKSDRPLKDSGPAIDHILLNNTQIVGLGAIGNAVLWTLGHCPSLKGNIDLIDHQDIDLSNLQRYVLATEADIAKQKVHVAKQYLKNSKLSITEKPYTWQEYIQQKEHKELNRIALCVDSAKDRIIVQSSLPKKIFNAWTQPGSLGVSRHYNFLKDPCICCLYMPDEKKKSYSELIAESFGLMPQERLLRSYIATQKPVDRIILDLISESKGIPIEDLLPFEGKYMEVFYSEVVCGGVLMKLENKSESIPQIEVPSAFESALAGILLAAEIIIDAGNIERETIPTLSRFHLLKSLNYPVLEVQTKHHSGRCICQDQIFKEVYIEKWKVNKH